MKIWEGVEEFVAVVEKSTFSAAAQTLGVSTSFISRQITTLEDRLGIQLLKRTTRKMNLTTEGEVYYRRCSELIEGIKEANEYLMDGQLSPHGLIRITGAGMFVEEKISPLLAEFMKKYPGIEIEIDFNSYNVDLIQEGYDLAIRYGVLKDSSLVARKLVRRKLSICGNPEYFSKFGKPQTPADLKVHNCLIGNTTRWRLQFPNGIREILVKGTWKSNSGLALTEAAAKGIGLIYLPEFHTKAKLESGELITVLDQYIVQDMATWLVFPNRQFFPSKVRLLTNYLANYFSTNYKDGC